MDFERNASIQQLYTAFDLAATLVHATRVGDTLDADTEYPAPMAEHLPIEQRRQLLTLAEAHLREVRRSLRRLLPEVDEMEEFKALFPGEGAR